MAPSSERLRANASAAEGARERPQAIGIIAAFVTGFSALFMLAGVPKVWELYLQHSDPVVGFIEELVYGGFVFLVILLGCLGIATGIGLFLLWRWARVSILIFSALIPFVFVMGVIFFLSDPTFFGPGDELSYVFGGAVVVLAVGIWSLFYFNRISVKRLFHARRKTPVAYS